VKKYMSFEEWFHYYESSLAILFAENGADREMDFDFERESWNKYEEYLEIDF
jgi:hypothetical protein